MGSAIVIHILISSLIPRYLFVIMFITKWRYLLKDASKRIYSETNQITRSLLCNWHNYSKVNQENKLNNKTRKNSLSLSLSLSRQIDLYVFIYPYLLVFEYTIFLRMLIFFRYDLFHQSTILEFWFNLPSPSLKGMNKKKGKNKYFKRNSIHQWL
jgi:hypothetical protein